MYINLDYLTQFSYFLIKNCKLCYYEGINNIFIIIFVPEYYLELRNYRMNYVFPDSSRVWRGIIFS